jgi:hypothetical protein
MRVLGSDEGVSIWLKQGYSDGCDRLFDRPDLHGDMQVNKCGDDVKNLVNKTFTRLNDSDPNKPSYLLCEGIDLSNSDVSGQTLHAPKHGARLGKNIAAYGATIVFGTSNEKSASKDELITRLGDVGIVGLDAQRCEELSEQFDTRGRVWRCIRLNDKRVVEIVGAAE